MNSRLLIFLGEDVKKHGRGFLEFDQVFGCFGGIESFLARSYWQSRHWLGLFTTFQDKI